MLCDHPDLFHAFLPADHARCEKKGDPIACPVAGLYVKGDWAEYSGTLGLASWRDTLRPCFLCSGSGNDLFVAAGNTAEALRWELNERHDYTDACVRCTKDIPVMNDHVRDHIVDRLVYDKRPDGHRGRCLHESIPTLGLAAGDRLEPSQTLPDIGGAADVGTPTVLTFWRDPSGSLCRRRNPLLLTELGLGPEEAITVDMLHCYLFRSDQSLGTCCSLGDNR